MWFEDNGVALLEWPPFSPDLNPIEHLWKSLKERLLDLNPDPNNIEGSKDTIKRGMKPLVVKVWRTLKESKFDAVLASMGRLLVLGGLLFVALE
jgi:transposase